MELYKLVWKMKNSRNSGIEILKIFSMILVILSHVIPVENGYSPFLLCASTNINVIICCLLLYGGPLGVQIYTISSAWFLIEKDTVKSEKIYAFLINSWLISVTILLVARILGLELQKTYIFKQIFPFVFGNKWFFNSYILLYMLHPLLNRIIHSFRNIREFKITLFVLFILYGILSFIDQDALFYNRFIGMVIIYFVTAYFKLYCITWQTKKRDLIIILVSSLLMIFLFLTSNIIGILYSPLNRIVVRWAEINNFLLLFLGIGLFDLFRKKEFINSFINYLSSITLYVYLIHGNRIVIDYVIPYIHEIFCNLIGKWGVALQVFVVGIFVTIISFMLSVMYNLLTNKPIKFISLTIDGFIKKIYYKRV